MRGEVALKQQDTLRALNDFNTAIEMDKYDPDAWAFPGHRQVAAREVCRG